MHAKVWLYVLATLIFLTGCRMCASPYDYCGPTLSGRPEQADCVSCSPLAPRAGSAVAPAPDETLLSYSNDPSDVPVVSDAATPFATPDERFEDRPSLSSDLPARRPSPFVRSTEPVIDFGIPPENIISITDRKLEDAPELDAATSPPSAPPTASRSLVTSRPSFGDTPRRTIPARSVSDDGWTARGHRPELLR